MVVWSPGHGALSLAFSEHWHPWSHAGVVMRIVLHRSKSLCSMEAVRYQIIVNLSTDVLASWT